MSEPPLPGARRQLLFAKYGPFLTTPFFFGFSTHVLTPKSLSKFDYFRSKKINSYFILRLDFLVRRLVYQ